MAAQKKTKFELAVVDLIREMRLERRLSQDKIAAYIGTNRSFIGQVESHETDTKYNLNHLNRLAYFLGCSPKDFIPDLPIPEEEYEIKKPARKKAAKKKKS